MYRSHIKGKIFDLYILCKIYSIVQYNVLSLSNMAFSILLDSVLIILSLKRNVFL